MHTQGANALLCKSHPAVLLFVSDMLIFLGISLSTCSRGGLGLVRNPYYKAFSGPGEAVCQHTVVILRRTKAAVCYMVASRHLDVKVIKQHRAAVVKDSCVTWWPAGTLMWRSSSSTELRWSKTAALHGG
jgi:hypothetical protein